MIPRKLTILDKDKLVEHLSLLQGEDRRLRFGTMVNNEFIKSYVDKSFDSESKWFGCDDDCKIISACHAAVYNGQAELGCSVDKEYRNLKLAQAMFDRAVTWLRSKGITDVFMHCLTENGAMKHIARKNHMTVVTDYDESEANVHLQLPTPFTTMVDAYADRIAIYDMMVKNNISIWKQMVDPTHT